MYLVDGQSRGIGDPDIAGGHTFHAVKEPRPVLVLEFIHGFQAGHRHAAGGGYHAFGDLDIGHLHAEKQHAMPLSGYFVDNVQGQLGFSHRWTSGDKHQIRRFNTARLRVKFLNAGEQASGLFFPLATGFRFIGHRCEQF